MDIILLIIGISLLFFNRTSISIAIMFALLTSYFQLGTGKSDMFVYHNISDCGLILFFIIWWVSSMRKHKINSTKRFSKLIIIISVFAVFLFAVIVYDMLARGTSIISEIQTYRHWLLLIFAIPFTSLIPMHTLRQSIAIIFYLSVCATVVIIADNLFDLNITHREFYHISGGGVAYLRGAFPTTFCSFYLLLVVSPFFKLNSLSRYSILGLFLFSIILSMTRSLLIASMIGLFMMLVFVNKTKMKNVIWYGLFFVVVLVVVFLSDGFADRIEEGIVEVVSISKRGTSADTEGNFIFRLQLFQERAEYVFSSFDKIVFGIGGVKEQDFNPIFNIGLDGTQLDTGDIAWPLLFLRLGFVGSLMVVLIWIVYARLLRGSKTVLGRTGWVFLIVNVLLSFCSTLVAMGYFWLFITMILFVSYNTDKKISVSKFQEIWNADGDASTEKQKMAPSN